MKTQTKKRKSITTKNTELNNKKNKRIYVKDKSIFCGNINQNFKFKIENVFSDRTFSLYKNLEKKNTELYKEFLTSFLIGHNPSNDYEKLVWTSEFLEIMNIHQSDIFIEYYKQMIQTIMKD